METVLNFDLNDHEDKMAHMRCIKATEMAIVLFDMTQIYSKFEFEAENADGIYILEKVQEYVHDLLKEYSLNLDDLIE